MESIVFLSCGIILFKKLILDANARNFSNKKWFFRIIKIVIIRDDEIKTAIIDSNLMKKNNVKKTTKEIVIKS